MCNAHDLLFEFPCVMRENSSRRGHGPEAVHNIHGTSSLQPTTSCMHPVLSVLGTTLLLLVVNITQAKNILILMYAVILKFSTYLVEFHKQRDTFAIST